MRGSVWLIRFGADLLTPKTNPSLLLKSPHGSEVRVCRSAQLSRHTNPQTPITHTPFRRSSLLTANRALLLSPDGGNEENIEENIRFSCSLSLSSSLPLFLSSSLPLFLSSSLPLFLSSSLSLRTHNNSAIVVLNFFRLIGFRKSFRWRVSPRRRRRRSRCWKHKTSSSDRTFSNSKSLLIPM